MKTIAIIFTEKLLTSKAGNPYYSAKTPDAGEGEFNAVAFPKVSKAGKKYVEVVRTDMEEDEKQAESAAKPAARSDVINPDDLPF